VSQENDDLGRPTVSNAIKDSIDQSFKAIPPGKKGALLLVADKGSETITAHIAANLDDKGNWKVAAGAGWEWGKKAPDQAFVSIAGSW
jgi:hypothetical protein